MFLKKILWQIYKAGYDHGYEDALYTNELDRGHIYVVSDNGELIKVGALSEQSKVSYE